MTPGDGLGDGQFGAGDARTALALEAPTRRNLLAATGRPKFYS
jgi:hypothetical protein